MSVTPLLRAAEPTGRQTLAETLRLQLADEIVRGALQPGTALDETELARRFAVSRTPVREAIRLLAASGLVETPAHRAAVVARPTAERLAGMFEVMAELEAPVRRACGRAHDRRGPARAGSRARGAARAHPLRRSAALS